MAAVVASAATIMPLTSSLRVSARPVEKISLNKAFGLKSVESRTRMMASYKVTFKTPSGDQVVECGDDTYVLDAAEEAGLDLPYSCRAGACSACAGKVDKASSIDQSDGSFLEDFQIEAGYILTCVAYPTADVTIVTHQEDNLPTK